MNQIKPTNRNLLLFSVAYQLLPLLACFHAKSVNPDSKLIGLVLIFIISEFVLVTFLINWKKRKETTVIDEMELITRLKVKALTLKAVEISLGLTIVTYLFLYREMPTLMALGVISIPPIIGEAYANIRYRWL